MLGIYGGDIERELPYFLPNLNTEWTSPELIEAQLPAFPIHDLSIILGAHDAFRSRQIFPEQHERPQNNAQDFEEKFDHVMVTGSEPRKDKAP